MALLAVTNKRVTGCDKYIYSLIIICGYHKDIFQIKLVSEVIISILNIGRINILVNMLVN